jgi:hypothetical protein
MDPAQIAWDEQQSHTPTLEDLVFDLREAREARHDAEFRERTARESILTLLNGESRGLTASGDVAVTVVTYQRTNVNSKKLQALYPDVYDDVIDETTVQRLDLP